MVLQASVVLSSSRTKLGIVKKVFLITELCTIESIALSRDARLNLKTGIWLILTEGHEVVSSLPLQMALYFNVLFFPIWFISEVIMLELKYHLLPAYYQYLLISAVTILTITESLRLYLGYIGNLQEKVPELSGFLLLTFLIQMPLILFLLTDEQIVILPLEFAVHTIYIIFLNFELLVSFFALKIMTRQLATQFYLQSTDDLEAKALPSKVKKQQSTDFITEQQKKNALMY